MDAELAMLDDKIGQLIHLCQQLKSENHALRQQVLSLQQQKQLLSAKVDGTKTRVAAILAKLPAEDDEENDE
ncbi:hypothetical protein GCM10007860_01580 [Chitiniphilus shinanonensis]|uniref:TIGR02449 family protein n=1 Tax=Chitiniphilus shinanonensis TaxID=553088 RepID=A0ABQ6BLX6_9NEIS|nr:hypothetical protein [Chitiniphilus shinanonensis]GLS03015.1 hypothetical protein GCM10007860_01580 [Chitiniphilus shinanonensis]